MPTKTTKYEQKLGEIRLEQARQALAERQLEEEERAARRERFRLNDRIHDGVLASVMSEPQRASNEEHRREWLERKREELEERAELLRADEERAGERSAQERLLERLNLNDLPKDLRDRLKTPVLVQPRLMEARPSRKTVRSATTHFTRAASDAMSERIVITPELARRYLARGNQDVDRARVARYAGAMRNGKWESERSTISIRPNGVVLDGFHRLHACVEADCSFPTLVINHVPWTSPFPPPRTIQVRNES